MTKLEEYEKRKEYLRVYSLAHREKRREYMREYRQRNKEVIREKRRSEEARMIMSIKQRERYAHDEQYRATLKRRSLERYYKLKQQRNEQDKSSTNS